VQAQLQKNTLSRALGAALLTMVSASAYAQSQPAQTPAATDAAQS